MLRAVGFYVALLGLPVLLLAYAHAEMINSDLDPADQRVMLAKNLLSSSGIYLGAGVVVGGLWLAAGRRRRAGSSP